MSHDTWIPMSRVEDGRAVSHEISAALVNFSDDHALHSALSMFEKPAEVAEGFRSRPATYMYSYSATRCKAVYIFHGGEKLLSVIVDNLDQEQADRIDAACTGSTDNVWSVHTFEATVVKALGGACTPIRG